MNSFLNGWANLEVIALAILAVVVSVTQVDKAPKCNKFTLAQMAPLQAGVPQQQWCCCGSCCNWAINCDAIPGCGSC